MRKVVLIMAVACVLTLCSCRNGVLSSTTKIPASKSASSSITSDSSSKTLSGENIITQITDVSATGNHRGQTVTMEYKIKTSLIYPQDMGCIYFMNNYAVFYDYNPYPQSFNSSTNNNEDAWNAINLQGERLLSNPYFKLSNFNSKGVAVAQKHNGEYVSIDSKGNETVVSEQDFLNFNTESSVNDKQAPASDNIDGLAATGYIYDGLALYAKETENGDYLLGLVDENGIEVIPAFIPITFNPFNYKLSMHENATVINDGGFVGIVTITRS